MAADEWLRVEGLCKRFPGVIALQDVRLSLRRGEVLAVLGENGAGKSTLMKILAGVQTPDEGQILLDGKSVEFPNVATALERGVVLIHQELNLADNLDVGANIFLGREPRRWGFIDRERIANESRAWLERVSLRVSPQTIVGDLPIGQQQLVEIAKAVSTSARILIMDEPTSSLSQHETDALFRVIERLRQQGVSIIYISHRLAEVRQIADRVVVLRDGRNAGELSRDEITEQRMVSLMVGREASSVYQRGPSSIGNGALHVTDFVTPQHPKHPLNFELRRGEMVALAGLVGAGRTEVLQTLFGITPALRGTVRVAEQPVQLDSPRRAIDAGLALVPEDRKQQGLILEMSVAQNMSLPGLARNRIAGAFLNEAREQQDAVAMIERLRIKTPHARQTIQFLSGGNQQKAVLAKWLLLNPSILLLDEPTRGVDVGAKEEIYRLMEQIAAQGTAILFVSSELPEVLALADRVLVMHDGEITAQLERNELSEETIMAAATKMMNAK